MLSARLVNVIACRTYAVVFGALTACYLVTCSLTVWWATFGPPHMLLGQTVRPDLQFPPRILYMAAALVLFFAVVCAALAIFAWMRSLVAVGVAFALWALVVGLNLVSQGGGLAGHPLGAILTAALALMLVAAIATRRRTDLPPQAA